MTNKKDKDTNEVEGEKSENIVHIDKDGAEEVKKLKATLTSKKESSNQIYKCFRKKSYSFYKCR